MPSTTAYLIVFGLFLDIVGAIALAIPDFPMLRNRFRVGRLIEGRRELENGTLTAEDTGFSEILSIITGIDDVDGHDFFDKGLDCKKIQYESISGPVFGGAPVSEHFHVYFDEKRENDDRKRKSRYDVGKVRASIEESIDKMEQELRGLGFILLITGFGLQIAAQVFQF